MKILAAFEDIPRTIIMAKGKAKTFPLNNTSTDTVRLHDSIDGLYQTLLRVLPDLIKTLNPETFRKAFFLASTPNRYLTHNPSLQSNQQSQR